MAIIEILPNSNPMVHTEIACTQDSNTIVIPTQPPVVDFCYCDFECEYQERVFASPGNEEYKNDKSSFLEELVDPGGTVEIKMFKDGAEVATITDDTYGEYFDKGDLPSNATTDHSLKVGFIADWEKIYALGAGQYYFQITITNFTREVIKESQKYKLQLFNERSADYTAVIKAVQNGYIQGGMDYTGLEWPYYYRIPGKFLRAGTEFVKTTYLNSGRTEEQIQAQTIRLYELSCEFVPAIISDQIIDDNIMANDIEITDYNLWNQSSLTYQPISVVPEGIDDETYYTRSQNGVIVFSFKPKVQDKLKRNYK